LIGCISGFASEQVAGFESEISDRPGLISELSGGSWGLQEGSRQARHPIALAQDSFDHGKAH
jgi:hypothetical protein